MPAWENAPEINPKNAWEDAQEIDAPIEPSIDTGNPLMNAIRGFAGRGNQAMAAINPLADTERLAAEKEWMKTHPGADIGSTIADIAMTLPAGGLGSMAARALGTAAIEGSTRPGSIQDRFEEAALGAAGSGLGEGIGKAASFLIKPFSESTDIVTKALIKKARDLGVPLNAANITGNKALNYADSALDFIPSSSGAQEVFKKGQREAWQKALLKQGNESGTSATPETLGAMKDRISAIYNDVASRNALNVDSQLKQELAAIQTKYGQIIPVNQKNIVKKYLSDFSRPPEGAEISGKTYQEIRSMLDKQSKSFRNSDPATYGALSDIRKSIDAAMDRSLTNPARIGGNAGDREAWRQANNDWMVMKNIEDATDPLKGDVSPARLLNNLSRKDPNRVKYGKGNQELTDIARVGKQFISPSTQDSGTAQRQMMIRLLQGGGLGSLGAMAYYDPKSAAIAGGAGVLGGILMPKAAGSMMRNADGYLVKGLVDLSKETLPGVTREAIIKELMRNAGVQEIGNN